MRTRAHRTLTTALLGAALVLAAPACGSDDDATSGADTERTDTATDDTATDDAGADESGTDDAGTDESGSDGGAATIATIDPGDLDAIPGVSSECAGAYAAYLSIFGMIGVPGAATGDVEEVFGDVSANVPEDLRDEVEVLAVAMAEYVTVLEPYAESADPTAMMADPEVLAAMQALSTPEVNAASEAVSAWFDANCQTG